MSNRSPDSDVAAERLERRWFAAFKAASDVRAECEGLLDAMEQSEIAWNRARARLSELEALRDALADELAELDRPDEAVHLGLAESVTAAARRQNKTRLPAYVVSTAET